MLIKTLRMQNFRQFKDETKIDFSCDTNKNITVILGDNTFGKTTLLQAFNWCLYGETNLDHPERLINLDLATRMQRRTVSTPQIVEVEIILVHRGIEYIITRTQKYYLTSSNGITGQKDPDFKVSKKQSDGQTVPVSKSTKDLTNLINNILPKDLSTYFFFDTERISNISTRTDLTKSVKNLLGLEVIEQAIKHLGNNKNANSVLGMIYNEMQSNSSKINNSKDIDDKIKSLNSRIERVDNEIKTHEDEIKFYRDEEKKQQKIIDSNQEIVDLKKEIDKSKTQIRNYGIALKNYYEEYFTEFADHSLELFAQPLIEIIQERLAKIKIQDDTKEIKDPVLRKLAKNIIEELVERGRCICGQELREGNKAYKHLLEELNLRTNTDSIGDELKLYMQELENFSPVANNIRTCEKLEDLYERISREKEHLDEAIKNRDEKNSKIKSEKDLNDAKNEVDKIRSKLKELETKKRTKTEAVGGLKKQRDQLESAQKKALEATKDNKKATMLLRYAEELLEQLKTKYASSEETIRNELQYEVNNIFCKMYSGKRKVKIDEKYQVDLLADVNGEWIVSGEAEGLKRVKNFAFISGLIALAKKKIINLLAENNSECYPLVMDAPFSNTDQDHIRKISETVPEIAEQVIIFVMQKDWVHAEPVMKNRVGQEYHLKKNSETLTQLV